MNSFITDASFLVSAIRSCNVHHVACYSFFHNHETATWVVPTIAYFEYQDSQSRLKREGKKAYRELYIPNLEIVEISNDLIQKTVDMDLITRFESLRGADLIYACIAKINEMPLVTCDQHFDKYRNEITIINPVTDDICRKSCK